MQTLMLFGSKHSDTPCPSCLAVKDYIRRETILPVAEGAAAPRSRFPKFKSICFDCAAAEGLMAFSQLDWAQARIATGNDRQEKLRLPGVPMGLPFVRLTAEGDLKRLQDWQDRCDPDETWGCDV